MPNNGPNLYVPSGDLSSPRVIRDLIDRINYLTTELDLVRGSVPHQMSIMARKENPIAGLVTIPTRNDGGQDGFIRVNPDGVISSYVNPIESLFPYVDITNVGTVGGGIDTLHTFTIPAGTLADNGDMIKFIYNGGFGSNANNKRIQILIDGQVFEDFGAFNFDTGVWRVVGEYIRVTSTTIRAGSLAMYGEPAVFQEGVISGTPDIIHLGRNSFFTVPNLNTNSIVMSVTGSGTANDDVTQNISVIEYVKPRTVKSV